MESVTSFAQAAEDHLDDVYGYLTWFTGDRFAAEDLAGETFERALKLWHRYDPARGSAPHLALPGGAHGGARPLPLERRRVRREELSSVPERYEDRLVEGLSPELESALQHLTAGEREVIVLRVVLDLDAGSAAHVLGISATNCTTRLNRALKKLEEALDVAA